ncbi:Uncharacterised protein [Buttiauxella agrestis]|uniref:Uncharacterized protein n=2 Tax=Buttiauxella TaxID=82976 RepID=A0A381KQA4_9ENTR|nr:Uncharacterised protein [Buttiauxella agrestis]
MLTVRKDAKFGITFNGVSAAPGESVPVDIDMGQGNEMLIPIFPTESGRSGESQFMIEIAELQ